MRSRFHKMGVVHRRLLAMVLALGFSTAFAAEQSAAGQWQATDAQAPGALGARLLAGGHVCSELVAFSAPQQALALCRAAAPSRSRELRLVSVVGVDALRPLVRELSGLGDASQAHLRLFAPGRACAAGLPSCWLGLVLVDQWDEGSCYGTQVVAIGHDGSIKSLGFIDEVRPEAGAERCIGAFATVATSEKGVQIELPPPLARPAKDGVSRALASRPIHYRAQLAPPALHRVDDTR